MCLRFILNTDEDFQFFDAAVTETLQSREWLGGLPEEELEEPELE